MPDAILDKYLAENKLKYLAQTALEKFTEISSLAAAKLSEDDSYSSGVLAAPNHDAYLSLRGISNILRQEYQKLRSEPVVGKVVIHFTEKGMIKEYYICRATPPTGVNNLISYRSPLGRLAALELGEEYDLGEETRLERFDEDYIVKVQQASFIPYATSGTWDSQKTEYRDTVDLRYKTINSLRKLIEKIEEIDPQQFFENFLLQQDQTQNIVDGIRKEIVSKFTLPDQIFLDSQQDSIFRLPLNHSLLLLGPAGTGKTTTLIRRLGQKLDFEIGLLKEEKDLVLKIFESPEAFKSSWIMFTPTELLKSYLKEAFNRENIPASDKRITTWESYRIELGRSVLRILRTSKFEGGFSAEEDVLTMQDGFEDWQGLFTEFHKWLIAGYKEELGKAMEKSQSSGFFKDSQFATEFSGLIKKPNDSGEINLAAIFALLFENQEQIADLFKNERRVIDSAIKADLGMKLKNDSKFLEKYSEFLASLEKTEATETDENEALEASFIEDEEDDKLPVNEKTRESIKRYRSFIMWLAGRPKGFDPAKSRSKNSRQLEWFGDRIPSREVLNTINQAAEKAKCIAPLYNPLNKFFNSIAARYGKFRKEKQAEGIFYNEKSALRKKISFSELDLLIYFKLKMAADLMHRTGLGRFDRRLTSSLRLIRKEYKAQVLVDEAPDFSPVQLGCMRLLAHPRLNSFFACGDFNQRLVSDGAKDIRSIRDFLPGGNIQEEYVSIPYRQTKSLHDFSLKVLDLAGGDRNSMKMQENIHANIGFHPALGEYLQDSDIALWLANRIQEIETTLDGNIPSMAILVPSEEDVSPIAIKLKKALAEKTSALVQACHEGQTKGDDRAIRVFDIKHIKGLEFEAAFFVSLDKLASLYPDLISNYLYVGSTRAAQFLGVTCTGAVPAPFGGSLRNEFVPDWNS